ncbi:hypothetical protein [Streptomyces flavidovirens]|uniref:hypothetical protein n=1 Tax=Streptomyces flavidovirens TaxID=67298 RepID=UPI0009979EBA|nr:hypothetical protein [Streptomyces flavidovirens]
MVVAFRRTVAAIGLAGTAIVGVSACEPGAGGMSSVAVAMTTDQTGTRALERAGVDVRWMSCTSTVGEGGKATGGTGPAAAPAPSRDVASVECEGETTDRQDIRIDGKVTEERDGRCVRGDLTARVGERTVFRADVLGDCDAAPTRTATTSGNPTPSATYRPTATVTATVTVTAAPDPGPDPGPSCSCPPSK